MNAVVLLIVSLVLSLPASGDEYVPARAHSNYQIYCQGCHAPDGAGAGYIPRLKDHVGHFLASAAGREYLIRVPGSATSALGDDRLAEVLNWILREFGGDSVAADFQPYTAAEVGRLRQRPLNETVQHRANILAELAAIDGERAQ